MIHAPYRPTPPLDRFVDFFWATERYVAQAPRERVLPTGALVLVVHLGEQPVRVYPAEDAEDEGPVDVSGGACAATQESAGHRHLVSSAIGVHFKPGRARALFDAPATAFTEQVVSLEVVWGRSACTWHERLAEAPAPADRVRLLERALPVSRRRRGERLVRAARRALRTRLGRAVRCRRPGVGRHAPAGAGTRCSPAGMRR